MYVYCKASKLLYTGLCANGTYMQQPNVAYIY